MDNSLNSTSARPLTNAEITRQFGITNNNVASAQSTADSAQTTANAAKTKTDSFTVNSGIISLKGIKTTTDSGNKHAEIGPQAGVNIYPAKTSGSAQGFSFKNSSGTTIGSFGCYTENEVLKYYYIGTYSNPIVKILPTGEVIAKKFTAS